MIDTSAPSPSTEHGRLAAQHVALVAHLVREMMARVPSAVDHRDLQAAGLQALLEAARETDASASTSFADRAAIRVRGALVDELRSVDWAVRAACPRDPAAARARLDAVLTRLPDPAAATVLERAADPAPVSAPPATPREGWADPRARRGRRECIEVALEALPERLQRVARGYFLEQRPMAEVAAEVGASESRAAQLRDEALVLLRDALATTLGSGTVSAEDGDPMADPQELRRVAYTRAVAAQYAARQSMTAAPRERTTA
jgi:RNA polymerase sigma factor for flagellar operon FliA